jgi:hypothetical protein
VVVERDGWMDGEDNPYKVRAAGPSPSSLSLFSITFPSLRCDSLSLLEEGKEKKSMHPNSTSPKLPPPQVVYDDGTEEEVSFPEPTIRFVDETTTTKKGKATAVPSPSKNAGKSAPGKPASGSKGKAAVKEEGVKKEVMVIEDGDATVTGGECDPALWAAGNVIAAPATLPTRLNVLETFAGAGGLHMSGSATFGGVEVSIQSVAAIDIVEDPCDTYRHNFPGVNVMHIGISRFVATGRRLQALKEAKPPSAAALKKGSGAVAAVIDFRITADAGSRREEDILRVKVGLVQGQHPADPYLKSAWFPQPLSV